MGSIIGLLVLAMEMALVESIPWKCIKHMIPETNPDQSDCLSPLFPFTCGPSPVCSRQTVNKNRLSTVDDVIDELQHRLEEC